MTKINDTKSLKYALCLALVLFTAQAASAGIYQHGTVVRMRMGDCLPSRHGFMVAFGGQAAQTSPEVCPEYTLVSDKVVFVIVGRSSDQLIPLADIVDFRFHNNDMAVRVDDARHESRFNIKEMILRRNGTWCRNTSRTNSTAPCAMPTAVSRCEPRNSVLIHQRLRCNSYLLALRKGFDLRRAGTRDELFDRSLVLVSGIELEQLLPRSDRARSIALPFPLDHAEIE
jgi:hypothetical protein